MFKPIDLNVLQKYANMPTAAKTSMLWIRPGWAYTGPVKYGSLLIDKQGWINGLDRNKFKIGALNIPSELFFEPDNWMFLSRKHVDMPPYLTSSSKIPAYLVRCFEGSNTDIKLILKGIHKKTSALEKIKPIKNSTRCFLSFIPSDIKWILSESQRNAEKYYNNEVLNVKFIEPQFDDENHYQIEYIFEDESIFGRGPSVLSAAIELYGNCYKEVHNIERLSIADIGSECNLSFLELVNDEPTIISKTYRDTEYVKQELEPYLLGVDLTFINETEEIYEGYEYCGKYRLCEGDFHFLAKKEYAL